MKTIETTLQKAIPYVVNNIKGRVHSVYDALCEEYTKENIGRAARGDQMNRQFWSVVAPFVKKEDGVYVIDHNKLEKDSQKFAKDAIFQWAEKIKTKIGKIENPEVVNVNFPNFTIKGTYNGMTVSLIQEIIINVSSRGNLFYQYPARIYVDGKKVSEAAFNKM